MIPAEFDAVIYLSRASLRPATSGKRFVRETAAALAQNTDYKITERQALYLWKLVYLYRRQLPPALVAFGVFVHRFDRLPDELAAPGEHRPPVARVRPIRPAAASLAPVSPGEPAPVEQVELFPELKHLTAL